jgi:hypothetical protein
LIGSQYHYIATRLYTGGMASRTTTRVMTLAVGCFAFLSMLSCTETNPPTLIATPSLEALKKHLGARVVIEGTYVGDKEEYIETTALSIVLAGPYVTRACPESGTPVRVVGTLEEGDAAYLSPSFSPYYIRLDRWEDMTRLRAASPSPPNQ